MTAPTTFLLIRHGACGGVGTRLNGRTPGIALNEEGVLQARELSRALAGAGVSAVYSSPMERARQTAEPLADRCNVEVRTDEAFTEIDFGEWAGATIAELEGRAGWREFNLFRSGTAAPGGESLLEVQARAIGGMLKLRARHSGATVAVVTHCDVIRALLCYWLGMPLDLLLRLEVSPGSVSAVRVGDDFVQVLGLNATASGAAALVGMAVDG